MTIKFRWMLTVALLAPWATATAWGQQIPFTPQSGLSGPSQGEGSLRLLFGHRRAFHVWSFGKSANDGSFVLKQTVAFQGQEPQVRTWNMRQVGCLRYAGTLSDAAGTVSGHTSGRHLVLSYRVKGPLVMHQTLELMPDGKTIDNVGRITLLGIPIGFLHETIRRGP